MADEAVKFGLTRKIEGIGERSQPPEKKIHGVTVATVINNIDCTGQARVQLSLPWLPGFTPWARLSNMMAGMGRGSFFVPRSATRCWWRSTTATCASRTCWARCGTRWTGRRH